MNIPDEATMAAYDALCAIYWPDTQAYDVATADLDTVSETVYTVLEAALPHMKDATFGKRVDDGEELARTHEAQAALATATPHLRAGIADEILDDTPGSPLTRGYQRLMDPKPGEHPVRTWEAAVRVMLDTLLEGGGEDK